MYTTEEKIQTKQKTTKAALRNLPKYQAKRVGARNRKVKNNTSRQSDISNLVVPTVLNNEFLKEYTEKQKREIAISLCNAVAYYTSEVWEWEFNPKKETIHHLIYKCMVWLEENLNVCRFQLANNDGEMSFVLLQDMQIYNDTVYTLEVEPVFKLKRQNRKLYKILVSFIKSLGYPNMLEEEFWIDCILEYMKEIEKDRKESCSEDYTPDLSLKFFKKNKRSFRNTNIEEWENELKKYNPRKRIYKQLKALLIRAQSIDFKAVYNTANSNPMEFDLLYWQSFLIADSEDGSFCEFYLNHINDYGNNTEDPHPYLFAIAKKNSYTDFDYQTKYNIGLIKDFITNFNTIINGIS